MKVFIGFRYKIRKTKFAWILHFPLLQPFVNASYLFELNIINSLINKTSVEVDKLSKHKEIKRDELDAKTKELTELAMKNKRSNSKKISVTSDFLGVMIFEAFLEAAPQSTLQIMIVLKQGFVDYFQMLTIVTSLISLTIAAVKLFWEFPTKVRFATISSRLNNSFFSSHFRAQNYENHPSMKL